MARFKKAGHFVLSCLPINLVDKGKYNVTKVLFLLQMEFLP